MHGCDETNYNVENIRTIIADEDPLVFIEDLLPFKSFKKSVMFRIGVYALSCLIILSTVSFGFEIYSEGKDWNFVKKYFSTVSFTIAVLLILVQFSVWCETVVKFPEEVRKICLNLRCTGEKLYRIILTECRIIKILCYLNIIVAVLSSVSLLPVVGDEAEFILSIHLIDKYFPFWKTTLKVGCCIVLPTIGYTLTVPVLFCTHYVSHIKFQFMILNAFLKQIHEEGDIRNKAYQRTVFQRLKLCIQLHNKIRRIHKIVMVINNPLGILMIIVSTLIFVSAAYFIIADVSSQSNFRMYLVLLSWSIMALTFCTTAQSLSDESEEVFFNAYNCPWICWNRENRRVLIMLMANSSNPMEVKIYITETNHTLLVKLWRLAYAALTCLANVQ